MPAALAQLGSRICIFGPSNSGKSTLAATLGQRLSIDVIHLDQLHHLPHTDWQPRPNGEFHALHDAAIQQENWIIEGNYSSCIPQRLARATGLILLDISTGRSLFRYLRRTLLETERIGDVEGSTRRIKGDMLRYITLITPLNRRRYADIFRDTPLPKRYLPTPDSVRAFYRECELERP